MVSFGGLITGSVTFGFTVLSSVEELTTPVDDFTPVGEVGFPVNTVGGSVGGGVRHGRTSIGWHDSAV